MTVTMQGGNHAQRTFFLQRTKRQALKAFSENDPRAGTYV